MVENQKSGQKKHQKKCAFVDLDLASKKGSLGMGVHSLCRVHTACGYNLDGPVTPFHWARPFIGHGGEVVSPLERFGFSLNIQQE